MSRNFQLTRETKDLLKDPNSAAFFESVAKVNQTTGLNPKVKGLESHTEVSVGSDGGVEVTFVYALDNNLDSTDGRIYWRDRFVFDSKEEKLKDFQRQFDFKDDGKKKDGSWQEWLEKYRKEAGFESLEKLDESLKQKAMEIGRSFARPIQYALRKKISENQNYLIATQTMAQEVNPKWAVRIDKSHSHFTALNRDGKLVISLALPIDDDRDLANGRLFVYDKFIIDAATMTLEKVERDWRVAPSVDEKHVAELQKAVELLKQKGPPGVDTATPFLATILPELQKPYSPDPEPVDGKLPLDPEPPRKEFPAFTPVWKGALRRKELREEQAKGAAQGLDLLNTLADEIGGKKLADSQGWARPALNVVSKEIHAWSEGENQSLKAMIAGAKQQAATQSGKDIIGLLKSQAKGDETKTKVLNELLAHPLVERLNAISQEPDAEIRGEALLHFARQDLMLGAGFGKTAQHIVGLSQTNEALKPQAEQLLQMLAGTGRFGTKLEVILPKFSQDLANPSMLVAMAAAPFGGLAAEYGLVRAIGAGRAGRLVASLFGLAFEAGAFSVTHRTLANARSHTTHPDVSMGEEVLSTAMLFALTRGAHRVSGFLKQKFVQSSFATEGAATYRFLASPMGRIGISPVLGADLKWWAKGLTGIAHHGAGIGAMYGSGQISQFYGMQAKGKQGVTGDLFDSAYQYFHAMAGFNLANRATGGKLQSDLAEAKRRVSDQLTIPIDPSVVDPNATTGGKGPVAKPPAALAVLAPKPAATGKGLVDWMIERLAKKQLGELRSHLSIADADVKALEKQADIADARFIGATKGFQFRIKELSAESEKLNDDLVELTQRLSGAGNDLKEAEKQIGEQDKELTQLREQVARELARALRAENWAKVKEQALTEAQKGLKSFEKGLKDLKADGEVGEALKEIRAGLEAAGKQIEILRNGLNGKQKEVEELQGKFDDANKDLADAQKAVLQARADNIKVQGEKSQVRRAAELASAEAEAQKTRADAATANVDALTAEKAKWEQDQAELVQKEAAAQAKVLELTRKVEGLEAQVNAAAEGLNAALTKVAVDAQALIRQVSDLTAANKLLERDKDLAEKRAERTEEAKKQSDRFQTQLLTDADQDKQALAKFLSDAMVRIAELEGIPVVHQAQEDIKATTPQVAPPAMTQPISADQALEDLVDEGRPTGQYQAFVPKQTEPAPDIEEPPTDDVELLPEDLEEGRPTNQYERFVPPQTSMAQAIQEPPVDAEEPDTLVPRPSPVAPQPYIPPAPRAPRSGKEEPIATLTVAAAQARVLAIARETASAELAKPEVQEKWKNGEAIELKFGIHKKNIGKAGPGEAGVATIFVVLDPATQSIRLAEKQLSAMQTASSDTRPAIQKLATVILVLANAGLSPIPGEPAPEAKVPDDEMATEPKMDRNDLMASLPSDATPAAGVDSPPSAHAVTVGVTPAGAIVHMEPTPVAAKKPDEDEAVTGVRPAMPPPIRGLPPPSPLPPPPGAGPRASRPSPLPFATPGQLPPITPPPVRTKQSPVPGTGTHALAQIAHVPLPAAAVVPPPMPAIQGPPPLPQQTLAVPPPLPPQQVVVPSPLPAPPPPVVVPPSVPPRIDYITDRAWKLEPSEPKVFGRAPMDGIDLKDVNLNKNHFRIFWESGIYYLEAYKSQVGTSVNGIPTQSGKRQILKDGDWIKAGRHDLQFHIRPDGAMVARPYVFSFSRDGSSHLLGSDPTVSHPVFDALVGDRHAVIRFDPNSGSFYVRDIGTGLPTLLNGRAIMAPGKILGPWQPIRAGDNLSIGLIFFNASDKPDGSLALIQNLQNHVDVETARRQEEAEAERLRQIAALGRRPSNRSLKGPPRIEGENLFIGSASKITFRKTRDEKEFGKFFLVTPEESSYQVLIKSDNWRVADLVTLEKSSGGQYKVTNLRISEPIRVHNERGVDRKIAERGKDVISIGDKLTIGDQTLTIQE